MLPFTLVLRKVVFVFLNCSLCVYVPEHVSGAQKTMLRGWVPPFTFL